MNKIYYLYDCACGDIVAYYSTREKAEAALRQSEEEEPECDVCICEDDVL